MDSCDLRWGFIGIDASASSFVTAPAVVPWTSHNGGHFHEKYDHGVGCGAVPAWDRERKRRDGRGADATGHVAARRDDWRRGVRRGDRADRRLPGDAAAADGSDEGAALRLPGQGAPD